MSALVGSAVPSLPLERSDEETALRETIAKIVGRYGHDYYAEKSRTGERMDELWAELSAGGFLGLNLPAEYGGAGYGLTELAVVLEELAAGGCPEWFLILSQGICGSILVRHGSEEQKRKHLPTMASGETRFAFALTEPDAGSNSHKISTSAHQDGDEWVVRGSKTFISGVEHADHFLLAARTGRDEATGRGEITLFIVECDAPGLTRQVVPVAVTTPERQWTLYFDDVRISSGCVVGAVGGGFEALFDGLNPERVLSAVLCTGVGRYALEKAARYACERQVWGVPIGSHQGVAHPLAAVAVELEAASALVWRAAALYDHERPAGDISNMAKYAASKAGHHALEAAIQAHGGNGMTVEYGLADLWGIIRLQQIAPVSTEMVLNHVAQHKLGLPRSY